jgi:hypothetical protein
MDAAYWRHAAQEAIRQYCGWHIAPNISETMIVDADGGRTLLIPSKHVTNISSITIDGEELLDSYDWSEAGIIQLRSGHWPNRLRAVTVTLEHGWKPEDIPHIQQLILDLAKRARSQPTVASQSTNGSSVTNWNNGGKPLGIQLMDVEKDMLEPYRLNWSPQ